MVPMRRPIQGVERLDPCVVRVIAARIRVLEPDPWSPGGREVVSHDPMRHPRGDRGVPSVTKLAHDFPADVNPGRSAMDDPHAQRRAVLRRGPRRRDGACPHQQVGFHASPTTAAFAPAVSAVEGLAVHPAVEPVLILLDDRRREHVDAGALAADRHAGGIEGPSRVPPGVATQQSLRPVRHLLTTNPESDRTIERADLDIALIQVGLVAQRGPGVRQTGGVRILSLDKEAGPARRERPPQRAAASACTPRRSPLQTDDPLGPRVGDERTPSGTATPAAIHSVPCPELSHSLARRRRSEGSEPPDRTLAVRCENET